jgi:hypothetical protein
LKAELGRSYGFVAFPRSIFLRNISQLYLDYNYITNIDKEINICKAIGVL